MTNRHMVKPDAAAKPPGESGPQQPNRHPLPPMPAPEDSRTPTVREEPIDSPQPNAGLERDPPAPGEIGLSTDHRS
ncbi:hypothetical protein HNR00_001487 [Methylorubrum rhodinum]|jgi:hypothetical protein|uniref:Uncharacterized protein n=1 Tax=Methylorubrum rhodinum TaxID=29428 RepID=A0A840ZIL3_9HYPH|nr:hypothetical protein [Methylorubrum rhodinum]MBB5756787.1 hypothetical protein [Methylorubrum rhodinum]